MLLAKDVGVDLGTSAVRMTVRGKGVVLREPAVIAVDRQSGRVLQVGLEAQRMLGRTPANLAALRPMRGGVIADYEMARRLLRELLHRVSGFSLIKPRLLFSVPSSITGVEERALVEAALQAGASRVFLIETPVAAALGTGLPISEPTGRMVIDIGAGSTDIAVISLSGVASSASISTAGDRFRDALIRYVRREYRILIGEQTAEELKLRLGCADRAEAPRTAEVKGRCLLTGLPKLLTLRSDELTEALRAPCEDIVDAVQTVLERTPPELVADIAAGGITLTGGGSLLRGLDRLLSERCGIPAQCADEADSCTVYGVEKALGWLDEMQDGSIGLGRRKQLL